MSTDKIATATTSISAGRPGERPLVVASRTYGTTWEVNSVQQFDYDGPQVSFTLPHHDQSAVEVIVEELAAIEEQHLGAIRAARQAHRDARQEFLARVAPDVSDRVALGTRP